MTRTNLPFQLAAQADRSVAADDWRTLFVIGLLALSVVLGLATAALAVYRYRRRTDPMLRALVVGLVLVAVAPLPFRIYLPGTVPAHLRELAPLVFQGTGLLSVLYAMYGDPRPAAGRLLRDVTRADLVVVGVSLGIGALTAAFWGHFGPKPIVLSATSVVVTLASFVAGQAARAAVRYRSVTMASLAAGIVLLAALPTPVGAVLLTTGTGSELLVVTAWSVFIVLGEAAMFATLAYR